MPEEDGQTGRARWLAETGGGQDPVAGQAGWQAWSIGLQGQMTGWFRWLAGLEQMDRRSKEFSGVDILTKHLHRIFNHLCRIFDSGFT